MAKTDKTYKGHYISGTHWDREWYRAFQEYRVILVEILDDLLDLMESSKEFAYFHLDGQTCILRDYLEVRPENRERLAALVKNGRILIGPWFTMPDLFGPGDEALVRNLLLGQRISKEWGVKPMPVAYTCDMFGHPSQMPQIYAGFDMPHCVLGRGANEHTTPAFFTWKAPDGSSVLAFKLQDAMGYGAFVGSRNALDKAGGNDEEAETAARESLRKYVEHEMGRSNGDALCLIDALDHMPPATDAPRYLRILHEAVENIQAKHSTLPAFFKDAEKGAGDLPVKTGELREPARDPGGYLYLIPNCVSSRVKMKQANDACQTLLERWVEPLLAFANLGGAGIPETYLRIAWENVLLNHAHDSICGCSIDQVHRDMMYRFDQARTLSDSIRHKALGALTKNCRELGTEPHEFTLCLANPLPRKRREVVRFQVDLPADWPARFKEGFLDVQNLSSFVLEDADGNEVPHQKLGFTPRFCMRSDFGKPAFLNDGPRDRYEVAAEVELPALGFAAFKVKPGPHHQRRMGSLRTGPASAANEHIALAVAADGTLCLTDKATGESYCDLLRFESRADIGDGWFHGPSLNDEIVLSGGDAQVSVIHDGPELVTFRVATSFDVPIRFNRHDQKRSDARTPVDFVSLVTLRRGAKRVEVETEIDNRAEDHRLRLLLPTDAAEASTWLAHHPYDLVERPIALDTSTADWKEAEIAEKPFLGLQAVGAGKRGLAFLSAGGLHEGGVLDDARRTMAVTLLRSYRMTVGTSGETDGLELGKTTVRYALMPYAGTLPAADALWEMQALQAGWLQRQSGKYASGHPPMEGEEKPVKSFVELQKGALILSACKPAEEGRELVIRLWNPGGRKASDVLEFAKPIKSARLLQMNEKAVKGGALAPKGCALKVEAAAHAIVTVGVRF